MISAALSAVPTLGVAQDAGMTDGAVDAAPPAAPTYFDDQTDLLFPTPPCASDDPDTEGCYTSFLTTSDLDGDGDFDIVFANGGGYYTAGDAEPSVVYLNDGKGAFRDATESTFGGATSRLRQVAVGDIDGDGDRDLYQPGGYGLDLDKLWFQTKAGVFENRAATSLPAEMLLLDGGVGTSGMDAGPADGGMLEPGLRSKAASAHFGDLDGDGDLDLAVGDWGDINGSPKTVTTVRLYENDGTGKFSALPLDATPPPLPGTSVKPPADAGTLADGGPLPGPLYGSGPLDIDMHDVDGDFDLDLLVIGRNGQSRIFFNEGKFHFSDGTAGYPVKNGPYQYNQELCDVDEDGIRDLLVDNSGGTVKRGAYITQLNINDGKGFFTDMTSKLISGEPGGDDNAVKCMDANGDGHFDLLTISLSHPGEKLMLNSGTGSFVYAENAIAPIKDPSLGVDSADLNGDGLLDLVTGQGESEPRIDRVYLGYMMSKKDVTPPKFRAVEHPMALADTDIVVRLAVSDAVTSDSGEHVSYVGVEYTVDGGALKMAQGVFVGGDLFRVLLPKQADGSTIVVTPTATDRSGLIGKATSFQIVVGMPVPDAGTGTVTPPPQGMDAGVPTMQADAGDTSDDGETRGHHDDGCSVSTDARSSSGGVFFLLGLALLALRRPRNPRASRAVTKTGRVV